MPRVVAVLIAGTVAGTLLSTPLAAAPLADKIAVRTYTGFDVPPRELATALETARAILAGAAIDVVWRECGPCEDSPGPRELIVRIMQAPAQVDPGSLGYSLVDVQQRNGTLATIFANRVESLATAAAFDPGVLLGRTIAHELAHLLMGTTEHSTHGLMRAHWDAFELERDRPQDWVLSRAEGTRMRRGLVARARRPRVPAVVVAARECRTLQDIGDGRVEPLQAPVAGLSANGTPDPEGGTAVPSSPTCSSSR